MRDKLLQNGVLVALAAALASVSCDRGGDDSAPPKGPPKPAVSQRAELIHAHYRLPARPQPPPVGML